MKLEKTINALKQKQAIISRTDDDHWLYEPITTVLEELETYKKALELACEELGVLRCDCATNLEEYFMQKARIENDD